MNRDLAVEALCVTYGGIVAVDRLSLEVRSGQLVGLIGPNGAGKTTTVDAVCGFTAHTGVVRLGDRNLSRAPAHLRARAGIARTWQSVELFEDLTVRQHCAVAAHQGSFTDLLLDAVAPRRKGAVAGSEAALETMGLIDVADERPGELPHGTQKLVGVARALASSPAVLMLDEPAAGLDSQESMEFGRRLRSVVDSGPGALLIDHDTQLVMDVCDHVYVVDFGSVIASGPPEQVRNDPVVVEAYLGVGAHRLVDDTGRSDTGHSEAAPTSGGAS